MDSLSSVKLNFRRTFADIAALRGVFDGLLQEHAKHAPVFVGDNAGRGFQQQGEELARLLAQIHHQSEERTRNFLAALDAVSDQVSVFKKVERSFTGKLRELWK